MATNNQRGPQPRMGLNDVIQMNSTPCGVALPMLIIDHAFHTWLFKFNRVAIMKNAK